MHAIRSCERCGHSIMEPGETTHTIFECESYLVHDESLARERMETARRKLEALDRDVRVATPAREVTDG